jgi:mono/diheme cytochrome c family protein
MSEVTENLSSVPMADVRAIATYVASLGAPSEERRRKANALREQAHQRADDRTPGAAIYAAACATCHDGSRPPPYGGIDLALSTGPSGPSARNVTNVVLWGLPALDEQRRPIMPGFAGTLNDRQLADVLAYVRARFSDRPPWTDVDKDIREARAGGARVTTHPAPTPETAPAASRPQEARE